ncbi:hypothetical protein OROGR_013007 [Orobanche gracilis]
MHFDALLPLGGNICALLLGHPYILSLVYLLAVLSFTSSKYFETLAKP